MSLYLYLPFNREETNGTIQVAMNPSTGKVLDSLDQALLMSVMCWLLVKWLHFEQADQILC